MNILILGGLGFIGQNLTKYLSKNHKVVIVDIRDVNINNYFKIKISETEKLIQIIEKHNIQIIIHLVSTLLPSSNINDYLNDVSEIYNPSIKLLNYCCQNKIKIVYFSSGGAVYGNQNEIFNEHTKREPISFYGLSKLNFETLIKFYHNTNNLNYIIIRPSNPYGYGQNLFSKQGIIAVIMGKILKNETIQIWGNGKAIKDYIYIDDFIFYVTNIIDHKMCWNQTYNIGSGIGVSVNDVLQAFYDNQIKLPEIEYIEAKKSDVKRVILDCTKIQEMFPCKQTNIKDGIRLFWDKVNENHKLN